MKILIVYVFCTKGGVETAIKNRIKNINYLNYQIDLLFFQDYGGKDIFNDLNCKIFINDDLNKVAEFILDNQYEFVITIDTYEIIPLLHRKNYKGKIGLEVHTTYREGLKYLKLLKEDDISFISVPSCYQQDLVKNLIKFEKSIYIVPNSIDLQVFYPIAIQNKPERPIISWVGRLDEHKNWKLFLKIAVEIKKLSCNKFDFWLIGGLNSDENQINQFQKMIYDYELQDILRWIPMFDYKKIGVIYNYVAVSGGAYITTSKNESFGMTVLEAMACKCPVVVNCVGALRELVDQDTGLLFNEKDPVEDVAKIILDFLNDVNLNQKIENAYTKVIEEFSDKIIAEKFLNILENILPD